MKKWFMMIALSFSSLFAVQGANMTVYKSPYCGCCTKWIDIMKKNGINVNVVEVDDVSSVNKRMGIPSELSSCHTAVINDYVVIGHVDYSTVKKMLEQKSDIFGLTVPGMPMGSPGMEQGNMKESYNVLSLNNDGTVSVFEKH